LVHSSSFFLFIPPPPPTSPLFPYTTLFRSLFAARRGEVLQGLLGDRQHAAGAAGAVIEEIGSRLDPVGDRQHHEPRHQLDGVARSEEHTSELQSPCNLVCRLLLEKKKKQKN